MLVAKFGYQHKPGHFPRSRLRLVADNLRLCLLHKTTLQQAEPATARYEAEPRNE